MSAHVLSEALILVQNSAELTITNSTFGSIDSTYERANIIDANERANVLVTDSLFQNNSALTATIFNIESSSFVRNLE